MKNSLFRLLMSLALLFLISCDMATLTSTDNSDTQSAPLASTIVFSDGVDVRKIGSCCSYLNLVSGVGEGEISYTSSVPAVATVNAQTGMVTPAGIGTTVITAVKAATDVHTEVSSSYLLTLVSPPDMVAVPSGSFQRDGFTNTITDSFYMSRTELTVDQYTSITGRGNPSGVFKSVTNGPLQTVSWYYALMICNTLSMEEGLEPVYTIRGSTNPDNWDGETDNWVNIPGSLDSNWDNVSVNWNATGYRMPTEMEWMWAAMGAVDGYDKPFAGSDGSNAIADYAWTDGNSGAATHTVATKAANELGIYDLSGNVLEWCWDWYGDYPADSISSDTAAGQGASSGTHRVLRGGSWHSEESQATVAYRGHWTPNTKGTYYGIRIVRR